MVSVSPRARSLVVALLLGVLAAPLGLAASATAAESGPAYSVPRSQLEAALTCSAQPISTTGRRPVLLVHGTAATAATNWDWNYQRALTQRSIPWCAVDLPRSGTDDVAVAAEYVTYAVRDLASRRGGRIDVIGWSQGGMVPRWSLKYWPDTRTLVNDLVGIDPSNHGTYDSEVACRTLCPPAFWQQATFSDFLRTLNAGGETFAGIDYTVVYTLTDEIVTPNVPPAASSELRTGSGTISNIPVQQICPPHLAEHFSMGTTDPIGWAVSLDAISNAGPARPFRTLAGDPLLCARDVMPGVDRTRLAANVARLSAQTATAVATARQVPAEPPVPAYAR